MASGSKKVIYAALLGNFASAGTQFAAAAVAGSSAMLSEGVYSMVDTENRGLLLYGWKRAERLPDKGFLLGHGILGGKGVFIEAETHHMLEVEKG